MYHENHFIYTQSYMNIDGTPARVFFTISCGMKNWNSSFHLRKPRIGEGLGTANVVLYTEDVLFVKYILSLLNPVEM
jgi:hypothetical protein